jgi:SAM-dependent methyltransferase
MAHKSQQLFFQSVKKKYPSFFTDVKILDIGSLDINGNIKHLFKQPYYYIGVDLFEGKNVNVVCPGHLYDSGFQFDIVVSGECFEHDMYYGRTIQNMVKLLKPGGLMMFTCASTGRAEHGTLNTTPKDAPFLASMNPKWANYYKNLTEDDIRSVINIDEHFMVNEYSFAEKPSGFGGNDLYFYGIKKY